MERIINGEQEPQSWAQSIQVRDVLLVVDIFIHDINSSCHR